MEITDLAAAMEGMVLVATMEEVALVAAMENQVLVGIRGGMDLGAAMVGLVLEEIAGVGTVSQVVQTAGEVVLVPEAV